MKGKFFIVGVYSNIDNPLESFRPTEEFFDSFQSSIDWIESHMKFFVSSVRFGICSVDNTFDYGKL